MSATPAGDAPIAVTVIAGFLGSGKTTLLNALLTQMTERAGAGGEKVAVIVNEFGEVGIDGALVGGGEQFVELDNGCLCCVLNEDLVQSLQAIVQRGGIDRIVLETTGLADPLPVGWATTRPGLRERLRLDALITVVDAEAGAQTLLAYPEARLQVERADVLYLSKAQRAADKGAEAQQAAQRHNPAAVWVRPPANAPLPIEILLGPPRTQLVAPAPAPGHRHAPSLSSVAWQRPCAQGPLDERRVEALAYAVPQTVVRFKGLLWVQAPEGPWLLVHGVAGRIDLRFCAPPRPPAHHALVFFGADLSATDWPQWCEKRLFGPFEQG